MNDVKAGDEVECIVLPTEFGGLEPHRDMPVVGERYVVSRVLLAPDASNLTSLAVGYELVRMNHAPHAGYHSACFRKVERFGWQKKMLRENILEDA